MSTAKIQTPHPGFFLKEMLDELGVSQYRLAIATGLPHSRVSGIINGRQNITTATALRLGRYFSQSAEYWLNLQRFHDLSQARKKMKAEIEEIVPFDFSAFEKSGTLVAA
ncbi:MAG: HigA family addiction module antidote protein [Puniceicoccales bacterium]|nr:HigA family addiction module antidote protein [Puniceicoccales bacterium]